MATEPFGPVKLLATLLYMWLTSSIVYAVHKPQSTDATSGLRARILCSIAAVHLMVVPMLVGVDQPIAVLPVAGLLSFSAFKVSRSSRAAG